MSKKNSNSRLARQNLEILETAGKHQGINRIDRRDRAKNFDLPKIEQRSEQNELAEATAHLKSARETADAMSSELAELNKKAAEARNERAALKSGKPKR